jgi:tRNA threonylcarbamoyl adenosine modification protein YeaZ
MPAKTESENVILAIESAIRGGSLALFVDGDLFGSRLGNSDISRAEDLLINIELMLAEARIDRHIIGTIAISNGPGSYTGIRIGAATALGLKNSLNAECRSVSVLSAMADLHGAAGKIISAVPTGKSDAAWQTFQRSEELLEPVGEPVADTERSFFEFLWQQHDASIVLHADLAERASGIDAVIDAGRNLAIAIGIAALKGHGSPDPEPLYLRNSQLRPGIY